MAKKSIDKTTWEALGLKADPFPLTPIPESDFVWAGQAQLKTELDEIIKQGRATDSTQFVGLVAPWGSGKTHALGYYSHPENLPTIELQTLKEFKFVGVTFPKSEKQIAEGFFHRVVDKLNWTNLIAKVVDFGQAHPDEYTKLISPLLQDNADLIRAFDYLRKPELDEATSFAVQSYLFGQASKRDRDKLRFIRPGNSVEERYLSLNAFLALETGWKSAERTRLVLWIDEAENLIKLSSSNFDPFTQGLRDVLDVARKVFGCLTVIINFTPESRNFEGEMFAILGSALYDRIDKKITIPPMNAEDAKTFVLEALRGYALDPSTAPKIFTQGVVDFLPTILGEAMTPRRVNRICSALVNCVLTDADPLTAFPIPLSKAEEIVQTGKISAALLPDRPSM